MREKISERIGFLKGIKEYNKENKFIIDEIEFLESLLKNEPYTAQLCIPRMDLSNMSKSHKIMK